MSTTTTRLGLYKPAASGSELVNVVTDLNNNLDSLDAKMGAFSCPSTARPGSPYNGQFIRESDTGKMQLWDGSQWVQVLYGAASFGQSINLPDVAQQVKIGGSPSSASFSTMRTSAGDLAFSSLAIGDTQSRWTATASGSMAWGPGGSIGPDTNLYRTGANTLKTDNDFNVGGVLTVSGDSNFSDATISGNLNLGSATYRNQLSLETTVSNTTTETALATMSIPANDAVVGAMYRMRLWGTLSVTGTPTMTLRAKLDAVNVLSFPAVTIRSGATDGAWDLEYYVIFTTVGASGAVRAFCKYTHNFLTSVTTYTPIGPLVSTGIGAKDTTVSQTMQVTGQWSAASASNAIVCRGFAAERVA